MTRRLWDLQHADGTHRHVWSEFRDVHTCGALIFYNVADSTTQDPSIRYEQIYALASGQWIDVVNITLGPTPGEPAPTRPELGRPPADVRRARSEMLKLVPPA